MFDLGQVSVILGFKLSEFYLESGNGRFIDNFGIGDLS